jgi:hypothetical protein
MMCRIRFTTLAVVAALVSLAFAGLSAPRQTSLTLEGPNNAATRPQPVRIAVEPPIQVSRANSSRPHFEVQIASDPSDAKRLVACSIMLSDDQNYLFSRPSHIVLYTSVDSGFSWIPTHELDNHQYNTDPACAFGLSGNAYFMSFGGDLFKQEEPGFKLRMPMYRSMDGAKTWTEVGEAGWGDREYITVDDTPGKYHGRVYVHAINGVTGIDGARINGLTVFRSTDGGQTYKSVKLASEGLHRVIQNANGVVMSDGTFATVFGEIDDREKIPIQELHAAAPNGKLKFMSSTDGGESFTSAVVVGDSYTRLNGALMGQPSLATDRTQGPFRNRLYAAWVDARSGRGEIRFAPSSDKGKTWSPPFVISDNWSHDALGETPDAFMPELAVNRDGVLGVLWYDRRDHLDNLGYEIRFSASLDGGESFLPSVMISPGGGSALQMKEALLLGPFHPVPASDGRTPVRFDWSYFDSGGDTAGLTCDLDGVFHPLWIDRRSGLQQVWTSRVTVSGVAKPNGGAGLESLRDLSSRTEIRYSLAHVDLATNEITVGAAIINTSKDPIAGPLTLRLLVLSSSSGLLEVQNADNGLTTAGAIWRFQTTSGGLLEPGHLTVPRQLRFKFAHTPFPPLPLRSSLRRELVEMDTKIIGH